MPQPWLVWLSGLSASLRIKGSLVQFPSRAHAWVASQVPSRGCMRGNHTWCFSPSLSPSPPFCLKIHRQKENDASQVCVPSDFCHHHPRTDSWLCPQYAYRLPSGSSLICPPLLVPVLPLFSPALQTYYIGHFSFLSPDSFIVPSLNPSPVSKVSLLSKK